MQCFMVGTIYPSNSFPVLCVSSHMPPFDVLDMEFLVYGHVSKFVFPFTIFLKSTEPWLLTAV